MRVTQGAFSFLPDLTDQQIRAQIEYCLRNNWAVSVEYTDDIHPRNTYWEMFGMPMFDLHDAAGVMAEVEACRKQYPNHYVKVNAFDSTQGWEALRLARALFFMKSVEENKQLAWPKKMIEYGAQVLDDPADLLEALPYGEPLAALSL